MVDPIPPKIKRAWEKWNIRGTILFSLSLQIFLILLAPYRKCTRKRLLIMLIWSAYLLADAAANFTVGLISNSQGDDNSGSSTSKVPKENEDLLAFWAPFLLLHLGGPDTITSFALEDNELWLRHLLGLGFQALAALYVFVQSIPNKVWIPTVLTFVAGTIKYYERTLALYLASLDRLRDSMIKEADPGPNYAKLMEEYAFKRENKLPFQIIKIPETDQEARGTDSANEGELSDLEVVRYAYKFFLIFKGLVVDLIVSFRERNESREFFENRKADDALRVIEVELNFIYEVLFTKVQVMHSNRGYIFRGIAFGSIIAALAIFCRTKKDEFNQFDVVITYTLLLGAVALDVIGFLMLIFSDWTFATIKDPDLNEWILAKIFSSFLWLRRPWWREYKCKITYPKREEGPVVEIDHHVLATPILFRRWSGSLSSYNLISYCLKSHTSRIHKFTRWPRVIAENIAAILRIDRCYGLVADLNVKTNIGSLSGVKFTKRGVSKVRTFLVDKLKQITWPCHIIKRLSKFFSYIHRTMVGSMGVMGLRDFIDEIIYVSREPLTKELWEFIFEELKTKAKCARKAEAAERISVARGEWVLKDCDTKVDTLMRFVTDVQYDESLLLWHIATDLCYYNPGESIVCKESFNYREFSKLLSDYLLYLLIMQPTMMSAVGGIGKTRFRDTCAEAERFFFEGGLLPRRGNKKKTGYIVEAKACKAIFSVNTDVKPVIVKGDGSKSVLFDASMLAQELNKLEAEGLDKWKLLSRVWVELISYAASHCRADTHAQQLSKGGELITFIWLLMAHFGLGEQFQTKSLKHLFAKKKFYLYA